MKKKNEQRHFYLRLRRERERQALGNNGAASEVRHVDPANYQQQEPPRASAVRPAVQKREKTLALLAAADKLLVADAKRRFGKRQGKRVRNFIRTGRYR